MIISLSSIKRDYPEMDALTQDYYDRGGGQEGMPPLKRNWPKYIELERLGMTMHMIAKEDKKLVGFVVYFLMDHMHHTGTTVAICDTLATHLDERGKGVGRALVEAALPELKRRHVDMVIHSFRAIYKTEPLFPKLGFELFEKHYVKRL